MSPEEKGDEVLLRRYAYRLFRPKCNPSADTFNALGLLSDDVAGIMPYLNAVLKGCAYNSKVRCLTIKRDGRAITLHPRQAAISKLADGQDARRVLEWLKDTINDVYRRRREITPSYQEVGELRTLDMYRFLPRTNCGRCGEATCLAFALKLATGDADLSRCEPLLAPGKLEEWEGLTSLLRAGERALPGEHT